MYTYTNKSNETYKENFFVPGLQLSKHSLIPNAITMAVYEPSGPSGWSLSRHASS